MKSNSAIIVTVAVIVIIIIGILAVSYSRKGSDTAAPTVTVSSTPQVTTSPTATVSPGLFNFEVKLGESITINSIGLTMKPAEIAEDSRCPLGVQCIQAGTVRVRTEIATTATTSNSVTFKLGTPVAIGSHMVTLTQVTPAPVVRVPTLPADYHFSFEIR